MRVEIDLHSNMLIILLPDGAMTGRLPEGPGAPQTRRRATGNFGHRYKNLMTTSWAAILFQTPARWDGL